MMTGKKADSRRGVPFLLISLSLGRSDEIKSSNLAPTQEHVITTISISINVIFTIIKERRSDVGMTTNLWTCRRITIFFMPGFIMDVHL